MSKITVNIDASSLSSCSCILNWKQTIIDGYRDKTPSCAIIYGVSVHKYIDSMYKTGSNIATSRDAALTAFRKPKIAGSKSTHLADERHLITTCYNVWEEWISKDEHFKVLLLPNGQPATELTFSLPYYEDDHLIVRLAGTIDRIGQITNGIYAIRDFKTTSSFRWQDYLNRYKLSKQLRFYVLALKIMSERFPDSMLGKIGAGTVGAVIDGIFLKPKASENEYHSSDVYTYKHSTMDEFRSILDTYIRRLSSAVQTNTFPQEGIFNNTCVAEYPCKFRFVCGAPSEVRPVMLERDFRKTVYDPLNFNPE